MSEEAKAEYQEIKQRIERIEQDYSQLIDAQISLIETQKRKIENDIRNSYDPVAEHNRRAQQFIDSGYIQSRKQK